MSYGWLGIIQGCLAQPANLVTCVPYPRHCSILLYANDYGPAISVGKTYKNVRQRTWLDLYALSFKPVIFGLRCEKLLLLSKALDQAVTNL